MLTFLLELLCVKISLTHEHLAKTLLVKAAAFSNTNETYQLFLQASRKSPRDGGCRWWSLASPNGRTRWTRRQRTTVLIPCQNAGALRGCVLTLSPARPRCRACRPPWSPPPRRNRPRTWTTRRKMRGLDPWGPSPRSDCPSTRTSSVDGVDLFDDRRDIRCSPRSCDAQVPPFERTCPWQAAFCRKKLIANFGPNLVDASCSVIM